MKKNKILIILFIAFLIVPSVLFWFISDKMDKTNYENRTLYEKPKLILKNIVNYPKEYENYFNDHLAFKNEVRKIRSILMYKIFRVSSNENVIIGKNGWLFFTGNSTITDYMKTEKYSKKEKYKMLKKLTNTKNKLKEKNVDFYILILPNKETVYSDKLEKIIKQSNNKKSKIDDLIDYMNEKSDLNIIYPKDDLIKNRVKYETYYKYDTHWNEYGAYFGIMQLMKEIDSNFNAPKIKVSNKEKISGDLAVMNLMNNVKNKEPAIDFKPNVKSTCNEEEKYVTCKSDIAMYDKTLLFVGDSFRNATVNYLSKLYKNVIIIHKDNYKEDYIEKYNVDIVVYESVERLSDTLMDTDILLY